jgi:hypothetical protein
MLKNLFKGKAMRYRELARWVFLICATWMWTRAAQSLSPPDWTPTLDPKIWFLICGFGVPAFASSQIERLVPSVGKGSADSSPWTRRMAGLTQSLREDTFLRPRQWLLLIFLPLAISAIASTRPAYQWQILLLPIAFGAAFGGIRAMRMTDHPAWPFVTLALSLAICLSYLSCGERLLGSTNNDAAYYYGVARHIAETGHFEEPIVWHHLVRPSQITHAPFDYWPALPSLWLVPIFKIFGSSPRVLGLAGASVSCVSVLLFWFLISVQRPVRSAWLQVVALLLFAFSPPLWHYRFVAETVPWAHVWILASLIFLSRRQPTAAATCAFALFLSRPDCIGITALVGAFGLVGAIEAGRLRLFASTCFALVGAYMAHHLLLFGSVTPPGSQLAPRLIDGMEIYRFRQTGALLTPLSERFTASFFEERSHLALEALRKPGFVPFFHLWFFLALAGGARRHFRSDRSAHAAWLILPIGALVPSLLSPSVFAWWRTLHVLLPILLLVGCHGLDTLLSGVATSNVKNALIGRVQSGLAGVLACGFALLMIADLKPYLNPPTPPSQANGPKALAKELDGAPVMSMFPWFVMSVTRSPAVGLPSNGEDAVLSAISHYKAGWLMISSDGICQEQTTAFCQKLIRKRVAQFGQFEFTRVATGGGMHLFRIAPLGRLLGNGFINARGMPTLPPLSPS